MGVPAAVGRAARRFDRLLGRAVYRTIVRADDWDELVARLEAAVRERYAADYTVRVTPNRACWNIDAVRGLTGGFGVTLVPRRNADGTTELLLGLVRTSRLDHGSRLVAAFFGLVAFVAAILAVGAVGVPLPGIVPLLVVGGVTIVALLAVYQLLIPVVAALEFIGGGRFDRDATAAVVALVRGVLETTPGVAVVSDTAVRE